MVTTDQMIGFGLVVLVLIAIPGPSVVFTVGRALTYGRAVALLTVAGNALGLLAVLVLVSMGLGDLVATSDTAFEVLKLGGAAYLVWLGVQAFRHRQPLEVPGGTGPAVSRRTALRQGFMVGLTNPKLYVIFAAVLPPFVDRSRGHGSEQMLLLGSIAFVVALVFDSVWALLASQLRRWFSASANRGRALGTLGGLSMVGLGVAVAVTGRADA